MLTPAPPGTRPAQSTTTTTTVATPAPPSAPRGAGQSSGVRRQALAVLLRDAGGKSDKDSDTAKTGVGASTKSRHRTRQLLRQVHEITTMTDLFEQEANLRQLVITNQSRKRDNIHLLKLQSIQFADEKIELRELETKTRQLIELNEAAIFNEELGYHACICGEATERARIERQYPPQVLKDLHFDLASVQLDKEEVHERVDVIIALERLEREHIVSCAMYQDQLWMHRRVFFLETRGKQGRELEFLSARQDERLVVEHDEMSARTKLEGSCLQELALLITDGFIARRHTSYWDVESHETRARNVLFTQFLETLEEIKMQERRVMHYKQTIASRDRVIQRETLQRADIAADEDQTFKVMYLEALRQWQRIYDDVMSSRGPRVDIDKSEIFERRDIETDFFMTRSQLVAKEQESFWFFKRRDNQRSDFYEGFLDSRVALMRLERNEYEYHLQVLNQALATLRLDEIFSRLESQEASVRADLEFERWNFYLEMYLEGALVRVQVDVDKFNSAIQVEEYQARRTIHKMLNQLLLLEAGSPTALKDVEDAEEDLRATFESEEHDARAVLQRRLEDTRDAIEESQALEGPLLSGEYSGSHSPTSTKRATDRLFERENDARSILEQHESRGLMQLVLQELQRREGVQRQLLLKGKRPQLRTSTTTDLDATTSSAPNNSDDTDDASLVEVDLDSEHGGRTVIYSLVMESAEALLRWEIEWDLCFTYWDCSELMCIEHEEASRAEWERSEAERRQLVYDMRNQPLPKNVWLGALEGDENQIRTNVEFEAEIAAGSLLNYFKFVCPGYFDNVEKLVYRDLERNAEPQFFKMEISLAERIGDTMLVLETTEEPETRVELESECLDAYGQLRLALRESLAREKLVSFEQEIFATTEAVFLRMRTRILEEDVVQLTKQTLEDEQLSRDLTWLESRAEMLSILENFEEFYRQAEEEIKQRVLIKQGVLWDEHKDGAERINAKEDVERQALKQMEMQELVDLVLPTNDDAPKEEKDETTIDKEEVAEESEQVPVNDEELDDEAKMESTPPKTASSPTTPVNTQATASLKLHSVRLDIDELKGLVDEAGGSEIQQHLGALATSSSALTLKVSGVPKGSVAQQSNSTVNTSFTLEAATQTKKNTATRLLLPVAAPLTKDAASLIPLDIRRNVEVILEAKQQPTQNQVSALSLIASVAAKPASVPATAAASQPLALLVAAGEASGSNTTTLQLMLHQEPEGDEPTTTNPSSSLGLMAATASQNGDKASALALLMAQEKTVGSVTSAPPGTALSLLAQAAAEASSPSTSLQLLRDTSAAQQQPTAALTLLASLNEEKQQTNALPIDGMELLEGRWVTQVPRPENDVGIRDCTLTLMKRHGLGTVAVGTATFVVVEHD